MKDPAALLYIDKWVVATTEMRADARAYYMDLILFQFDKGSLPNDIEELANICRVRFSEFDQFKQVFEQVLKQKFKQNDEGRLENEFAKEIIQKRKKFIDKRSNSGKISYCIKYARKHFGLKPEDEGVFKEHLNLDEIDTKNEQVLKQVFKQVFELYINENEDVIVYREFNHLSINMGQFEKLKTDYKYTQSEIDSILNKIENYRNNKKYTSLYLTALEWLKKEYGDRRYKSLPKLAI